MYSQRDKILSKDAKLSQQTYWVLGVRLIFRKLNIFTNSDCVLQDLGREKNIKKIINKN